MASTNSKAPQKQNGNDTTKTLPTTVPSTPKITNDEDQAVTTK